MTEEVETFDCTCGYLWHQGEVDPYCPIEAHHESWVNSKPDWSKMPVHTEQPELEYKWDEDGK